MPPNNVLFNGLWERRDEPARGMFVADQAPANGFTVIKYVPQGGEDPLNEEAPQIRVWDSNPGSSIDRNRFEVLNNGTMRASGPKAASGTQTQDSPPLVLRGAYWNTVPNPDVSADLDWKVFNHVTAAGASPASRLKVQNPGSADMFIILDSGDIYVPTAGQGIILKSPNGTCYRVTITNGGALTVSSAITCP